MKKLKLFSLVFLLMIIPLTLNAQWTNNARTQVKGVSGLELSFTGTMDTTAGTYATLTSNLFALSDYDGVTDLEYSYYVVCAAGAPKVKITLLHSNETTTASSMIATVLQDSIETETETFTYKALQGIRSKYYRLKLESIAGGRDAAVFSLYFTLPKRDY